MKPGLWTVVLVAALTLAGNLLLKGAPVGVLLTLNLIILVSLVQRVRPKNQQV